MNFPEVRDAARRIQKILQTGKFNANGPVDSLRSDEEIVLRHVGESSLTLTNWRSIIDELANGDGANGFDPAWNECQRLLEVNARHRRGFRLREVPVPVSFVFDQASDELMELRKAITLWATENGPQSDVRDELADVLGVLFHLALKLGFTPEQLTASMLAKFKQRFSE